jgi:hypothetical protein
MFTFVEVDFEFVIAIAVARGLEGVQGSEERAVLLMMMMNDLCC